MVLPTFDDCVRCYTTIYNHLDVIVTDVFCHCGCNLLMADGIATVADGIATLVMTDVIVIVKMTILCNISPKEQKEQLLCMDGLCYCHCGRWHCH